ncbi:MAG: hypothetical protein ACYTG0_09050 [Planctomycetota bacterium]|jgi:hypothetical protein
MAKALCIFGMVIAGLLAAIFALDLVVKFPFGGENTMMDVGFIFASAALGYLSWSTLREQL